MFCFFNKKGTYLFSLLIVSTFLFISNQLVYPVYANISQQSNLQQQTASTSSQTTYQTSSSVTTVIGHPPANQPQNTATTNTCQGINGNTHGYALPSGKNFGDPTCDFTQTGLANIIVQQDPTNKYLWYSVIAAGESSYNPNAYLRASTSGLGAYGLFQMNPSSANRGYDAGDVYWKLQFSNAYNYNLNLDKTSGNCNGRTCDHLTWCYWATAQAYWCTPLSGPGHMQ